MNFTITAPVGYKVKQDDFKILPNYWTSTFSKIVTQTKFNIGECTTPFEFTSIHQGLAQ